MTENNAIECLKCYRAQSGTSFPEEIEMAINALEELEQYRAIGTVEECRAAVEKQKEMIAYCNENDCSDCYCNNGNWKETNRCMNDFIAEEIGQVAEIKWGDEE